MTGAALVGGTLCVPGELLAVLLGELEAARSPMGVAMPRRTPAMAALVELVKAGAIEHRRTQRLRESGKLSGLPSPPIPAAFSPSPVAASGRNNGPLSTVVSVAESSGMLGVSRQWVRALCRDGSLSGARKLRSGWLIPTESVHAYRRNLLGRSA